MTAFSVQDPNFESSVRRSFDNLTLMRTVGAQLRTVHPGEVEIDLPFRADLTQHHGYIAAAVLTAIVDVACGYAAMTLMPAGASVLTIEYKVNFLSPARGERMVARGKVVRPGRTVTVCAGDVVVISDGAEKIVATMLTTMATVPPQVPQPASSATHKDRRSAHQRTSRHPRRWCICQTGPVRRLREIVYPDA